MTFGDLRAPYCAIPRDYLSYTPLLRAVGSLVSQHGQLGAIPPPPFLSASPLESMRSGGAIPPLKRGIPAILARHPMKQGKWVRYPPLRDYLERVLRDMGGILHWAAKLVILVCSWRIRHLLGSVFGRTDFSRIFIFWPPDFFADFVAGFLFFIFVGKSAQKNPPGKSPAKSSKIFTTKIPDTFCRGAVPTFERRRFSQKSGGNRPVSP